MNSYRHTQIGWAVIIPVVLVSVVSLGTVFAIPNAQPAVPPYSQS